MTPFIGEIRMVAFNFAPEYWLPCDGQEINKYVYQELYDAIGTSYGGDGGDSFKLPDMRGRLPMHFGQGENLADYPIGKPVGSEFITLHMNPGRAEEPTTYTNDPETASVNTQPSLTVNFIIAYKGLKLQ
jgi:microcystin-dependent protein